MAFFDGVKLSSSSLTNVSTQVFKLSDLSVSFVEAKYSKYVDLNKSEKVIFIFSNIDSYVCEKNVATMSIKHFNLEKLIS